MKNKRRVLFTCQLSWAKQSHLLFPFQKAKKTSTTFSQSCSQLCFPLYQLWWTSSQTHLYHLSCRVPASPCWLTEWDWGVEAFLLLRFLWPQSPQQPCQPWPNHFDYRSRDPKSRGTAVNLRIRQNGLFYLPVNAIIRTFICIYLQFPHCQNLPRGTNLYEYCLYSDWLDNSSCAYNPCLSMYLQFPVQYSNVERNNLLGALTTH